MIMNIKINIASKIRMIIMILSIVFLNANICFSASQHEIKEFVSKETLNITNIISDQSKNDSQKTVELTEVFLKMVDAQWMAKFTLGMHWKELSKNDTKRFVEAYKTYLVNYYVPNFKKYKSNIFKIESVSELRKNEFLVKTIIKNSKELTNYSVDFRLIDKNGTIQIFDILTEGISIISTQRAEFNAIINKYGIDYLIDKLSSN
jgi:phospholipid transport system substrate-binding protein